MTQELTKAIKRSYNIGAFHQRYFVGRGVDIGGGPDPLRQYIGMFPLMEEVDTWDKKEGDAQFMAGVPDGYYDFACSSHCLEHLHDPYEGLKNWIRILKPGGYLIVTIPDEDLYELGTWPSRFNDDHKHTFTMMKKESWSPVSINVLELLSHFAGEIDIEKIEQIRDFFRDVLAEKQFDQTQLMVTECCIEFIVRKRGNRLSYE